MDTTPAAPPGVGAAGEPPGLVGRLLSPLLEVHDEYVRRSAPLSPEVGAAFDEYARRISIRNILFIVMLAAFANLVLWPADHLSSGAMPEVYAGFATMRPVLLALLAVVYGAVAWLPALRRRPIMAAFLVTVAITAGTAGPVEPLLSNRAMDLAYLMPYGSVALLVGPRRRAIFLTVVTACWFAVLFGVFAANRDAPLVGVYIGTWAMASLAAYATGHVLYRLTRDNFAARYRLERFAEELEKQVSIQSGEIRELSKRATRLSEDERRHIARELHDDTGQLLHAMRTELDYVRLSGQERGDGLGRLVNLTDQLVRSVRRILAALRPQVLDELGLKPALVDLARKVEEASALEVAVSVEKLPPLEHEQRLALFRIAQEALTNAVRHAGAKSVSMTLAARPEAVVLSVKDDGRGFDPNERGRGGGLGLVGIRERTRGVGGELRIDSSGRGTLIEVTLPLGAGGAAR